MHPPYPRNSTLIHPMEMHPCPPMSVATLFAVTPNCKQPQCPSAVECVSCVTHPVGILYSNKNEDTINTHNMDDSHKYDVE